MAGLPPLLLVGPLVDADEQYGARRGAGRQE
jgi:hypothetical protein